MKKEIKFSTKFKHVYKTTGRLIKQHQNDKLIFVQNLLKRSKIEKVNLKMLYLLIICFIFTSFPISKG